MISLTSPEDFKKEMDVVACYVMFGDKILLLKRNSLKSHGGKFGLPAGKAKTGEELTDAIIREIYEETGLKVSKNNLSTIDTLFVRNDGHDFMYTSFVTKLPNETEIKLSDTEHDGHVWATPVEALKMDLIHDLDECIKLHHKI